MAVRNFQIGPCEGASMTRSDLIATKKAMEKSLKTDSKAKSLKLLKKAGVLNDKGKLKRVAA